jgi:hypothetical protein
LGDRKEAAEWASRAASRPTAHVHILAISAACSLLAGQRDDALRVAARIRERAPGYDADAFLRAFQFDADTQRALGGSLRKIGFDTARGNP